MSELAGLGKREMEGVVLSGERMETGLEEEEVSGT